METLVDRKEENKLYHSRSKCSRTQIIMYYHYALLFSYLIVCSGTPNVFERSDVISPDSRIVGGDIVLIENVPFQLSCEWLGSHICGASIISEDWAISAAHCFNGAQPSEVKLRSGTSILQTGGTLHDVSEIISHAQFDARNRDYDIGLLRVSKKFIFSPTTAPLALTTAAPDVGTVSHISGWGTTIPGGGFMVWDLRWIEILISERSNCNTVYTPTYGGITDRMICANYELGGKDFCNGDAGGPLVADDILVGIASWGKGCGEVGYPGVYVNIADLRQWIRDNSGV